jgi:hypothetical protein
MNYKQENKIRPAANNASTPLSYSFYQIPEIAKIWFNRGPRLWQFMKHR